MDYKKAGTKANETAESVSPVTETPALTETLAPTETPTPTPTKTPTPTPTPTPEPTPEPVVYLGDLYAIPAETVVEDETIDMNNIDQYFTAYPIDDEIFARIYGDDRSFKTYCTLSRDELRYIKLLYRGFDLQTHVGELMVNTLLADDIIYIFKTLYLNNYQIERIVLVDNYCDDVTLDILSQKCGGANVTIATTQKSATKFISPVAVAKFNKQNPTLTIKTVGTFHDRFLILDGTALYHFGASLKDLGRHYCAVTKMDAMFIPSIMQRI